MRRWEEGERRKARIEIIPMIDVMMFLLVFFVLISINVIPALGIKTSLPHSSQAQEIKAVKNVIVTLAKTGETQLDGVLVTVEELSRRLAAMKDSEHTINVIINGDEAVPMQILVDALDAVKAGGIDSLSVATRKKS